MPTCVSCGRENPDDARFCNACGYVLTATPAAREQRKTVTVLFCDVFDYLLGGGRQGGRRGHVIGTINL